MGLISIGIDHENASLDLLERSTVVEAQWGKVLRTLLSHRNIHEAVFVSTCLRTEVIAVIDRFHGAIDDVTATLAESTGVDASEFENRFTVHFDRGVPQHLFSVASGLKSVVPGEFEILGQLRRALEVAIEENTAGPETIELFQRAIATGRRVRSETTIARGTTSFAQAAVALAKEKVDELPSSSVVVIGAGQLAAGIAKSILAPSGGCSSLTIVNRSLERAEALAGELSNQFVNVAPLNSLAAELKNARVVFSAVESTTPVVTREMLEGCENDLLLVDLGMPRNIAHEIDDLAHCTRIDIASLRERIEHALEERRDAYNEANAIVSSDVQRFLDDQRARGAAAIVSQLREYFDGVVETEIQKHQHDLSELTEEQRQLVQSLIRSVVAKLAHRPTVALKDAAGTDQGLRLSEATRNLFDL